MDNRRGEASTIFFTGMTKQFELIRAMADKPRHVKKVRGLWRSEKQRIFELWSLCGLVVQLLCQRLPVVLRPLMDVFGPYGDLSVGGLHESTGWNSDVLLAPLPRSLTEIWERDDEDDREEKEEHKEHGSGHLLVSRLVLVPEISGVDEWEGDGPVEEVERTGQEVDRLVFGPEGVGFEARDASFGLSHFRWGAKHSRRCTKASTVGRGWWILRQVSGVSLSQNRSVWSDIIVGDFGGPQHWSAGTAWRLWWSRAWSASLSRAGARSGALAGGWCGRSLWRAPAGAGTRGRGRCSFLLRRRLLWRACTGW